MSDTLGIYVISDQYFDHLAKICRAAVAKGKTLNIFFSYKGVRLTIRPDFKVLADIMGQQGKMSLCLHSFKEFGLGDEKTHIPGIDSKDFATQVRHAELLNEMDRYLVL